MRKTHVPEDPRALHERLMLDARLDRLDAWPWRMSVLAVLGTAFLWAYFDIQDFAAALPGAGAAYHVGIGALALAASLGLYGYIAGEVVTSFLSDLFGRKAGFGFAIGLVAVGSVLTGLGPNLAVFDIFRFVSGAGIGAVIGVVTSYLSELAPAAVRGRFSAWGVFPALIGYGLPTVIAVGLVVHVPSGWRLLLLIPALSLFTLAAGVLLLPESPRWLAEHGRLREAEELVARAEASVRDKRGSDLPPPVPQPVKERSRVPFIHLLRPPQLKWTLLMFFIWFTNYIPVYSTTLGITILTKLGYTLQTSIVLSLGGAIGGVIGAAIAPHITDRINRKYPAITVSAVAAIFYFLLAFHRTELTVGLAFGFAAFQIGIFAPLVYTATAEHFPTEARNVGVGLSDGVGHVGGAIGPTISSAVFAIWSAAGYFALLGGFFVVLAALLPFMRNTVGRTLEDLRAAPRMTAAVPADLPAAADGYADG